MILESFAKYLSFEKRYSSHTLTAYKSDLSQFLEFLADSYDVHDVLVTKPSMIRSWMVQLMQDGIEVRSIRRKRSVLSSFFSYAIKQELIQKNPMEKISVPKLKKKLPSYLRESELDKLESVLPEVEDINSARDRTIIVLLYSTGMRRNELINLKIRDLHLGDRTLKVLGKRNKERIVPLTETLCDSLRQYLALRQEQDVDHDYIFFTNTCKPLYPKFVYNLVKRYVSLVTSAEARGPHTLRHTFATLMLDEGADINAIKELLGHADLNATQIYTHTSIEKLKAAYGTAHPRARKEKLEN